MSIQSNLLSLSDLHIIGVANTHPEMKAVADDVETFIDSYGLRGSQYDDYSTMSFYLFPRTDAHRLRSIDMLMNVLYYIDDEVNIEHMQHEDIDGREIFMNCLQVFRTGDLPVETHPFYDVWVELHHQFAWLTTPSFMNRIVKSLAEYLEVTTYAETALYVDGQLSMERFIELRKHLSGMYTCVDMVEFAYDIDLPVFVRSDLLLRKMKEHCVFYGAMLNDIFSYHKESAAGSRFNLVSVMMETQGITVEEAVDRIIRMLNARLMDFRSLEAQIPHWRDPKLNQDVQSYIQGLRDLFTASWYWQISTNRYRSSNSPIPELRTIIEEEASMYEVIGA